MKLANGDELKHYWLEICAIGNPVKVLYLDDGFWDGNYIHEGKLRSGTFGWCHLRMVPPTFLTIGLAPSVAFNKYGFVHGNPVMGIDPSGRSFLSVTINIGILGALGAGFSVAANGVRNRSQGKDFWQGSGDAARNGAILGVVAGLLPFVGLGLALFGILDSFENLDAVLSQNDATDEQKRYAYGYVALNVFAFGLAKRGAGSPKQSTFWYNPSAFQSLAYRQSVTEMMTMSTKLYNFAASFPRWYNKKNTVSLGLLRSKISGAFRIIALSNQKDGVIPEAYNRIVPQEMKVAFDDASLPPSSSLPHAEPRIDAWAANHGYEVVGKAASKGICDLCATEMVSSGQTFFGPLQSKGAFDGTSLAELNIALGFDPAGVVGAGASGAAGGADDEDY